MKISFPGGERPDHPVRVDRLRIGSAGDNDLVLAGIKNVRPHHLELLFDRRRGVELLVVDGATDVSVNGRPVREKAILRLGDTVVAGDTRMTLRPADERSEKPPPADPNAEAKQRNAPPRVVLRGMAGPYYGKILLLRARTVLGRGADCDIVLNEPDMGRRHALIENTPDGLFLRDLGSSKGTAVNGVVVRETVLKPGDQLAFERNRFLIEAPGYLVDVPGEEPLRTQVTSVQRPLQLPEPDAAPPASEGSAVDWVIMSAAVVTLLALALLVYLEFGRGG